MHFLLIDYDCGHFQLNYRDPKNVEVIFVSNYLCLLGLPYITERTDFEGLIYATEPTITIGRQYMEEMINLIERTPKVRTAQKWKNKEIYESLPFPINLDSIPPKDWRQIYTLKELNNSLSKVKTIGFGEKVNIFGKFQVSAHSSGYCIGSCNWLMETSNESIVYLSSTSTLTTHPAPVDWSALRNPDIMIVTNLTQTPSCNPDSMLSEMCARVTQTLNTGGNVLIPCYPSGIVFDLFDCLINHLSKTGYSDESIYLLSPVADQSLAYSNILAEYLTPDKASKVYLTEPEEPFNHAQLVRDNRLKKFAGIYQEAFSNEFRSPCVVFTGHPSLRFGDVVHFIDLWKSNPNNLIVFTEPDFSHIEALAPYQPVSMKALYCPIDPSLNFVQINKLIRELKPSKLVVSEKYTVPPPLLSHKTDLVIDPGEGIELITYRKTEPVQIKLGRQYERAEMDSELAASLNPFEIRPGLSMVSLSCILDPKNNKYRLKPLTKPELQVLGNQPAVLPPKHYTVGTLDLPKFIKLLAKAGITDTRIEQTSNGCVIALVSLLTKMLDKIEIIFPLSCNHLFRKKKKLSLQVMIHQPILSVMQTTISD